MRISPDVFFAVPVLIMTSSLSFRAQPMESLSGQEVDRLWEQARQQENQGNYGQAIPFYEEALTILQTLENPQLKQCGQISTQVSLTAAAAAQDLIDRSPEANPEARLNRAKELAQATFVVEMNEVDKQFPELETSCP
jgi:hypothetical protein